MFRHNSDYTHLAFNLSVFGAWQDNAAAWERWVYTFAQMRQLPAMAPHIPIEHPTLRQTAYEMMLHAFLLHRADHSILLALVKDWPTHLYSVTTLTDAVLHRSAALLDKRFTLGNPLCFFVERCGNESITCPFVCLCRASTSSSQLR